MPMTKVYLLKGSTPEHRRAISDAIHVSLVDVLGIPDDDRYHIFHELEADNLITVPVVFGLERRARAVFIQLYFGPRPVEQLQRLYRALVANVGARTDLESRDIFINVVPSPSENWWADGRILNPDTGFDERMSPNKLPTI
jgi:Tautomerase enzyme